MTFNPQRGHGASAAQFLSFINRILRNHFISIEKNERHNPIGKYCKVPLIHNENCQPQAEGADGFSANQLAFMLLPDGDPNPREMAEISEFLGFIKVYNPELLRVLNCLLESRSISDAQARSQLDDRFFNRARLRLRVLYRCYRVGSPPPRQRRIYRARQREQAT